LYKILFTPHAAKKIKKLDRKVKLRIEATLRRIQTRPLDFLERLVNHPYYKLRIGDYRVIVDIIDKDLIILVIEVGHRRNIYKKYD
jgi:mRNA interferase RelE/StbE